MPPLSLPTSSKPITLTGILKAHLAIMRLDHSLKNIFVLPGVVVPITLLHLPISIAFWKRLAIGFAATTLIACSNYVINEVLDAPFDRLHPTKKNRPAALGLVSVPLAYVQWLAMMAAGITLGLTISHAFTVALASLWIMGCFYNIRPFRTKDVAYLDVVTESVNNPLRMLLGWYMVTSTIVPPASLLIFYWMIGCYFMALKRFSEYRDIGDKAVSGAYRASFRHYDERNLLCSITFYAAVAMLFFGAFVMRYKLELIGAFPFIAIMMATYFNMAFEPESAVQNPEKLYRHRLLMVEVIVTICVICALLYFRILWIEHIFAPTLPALN
ncbi:UbiA family prenyltransferase [Alloacidobacterium dinghuense]|uniref:UbiA family prenyltransferase n=1 Tax=Alloacidobacterium dinghuense TaxID=2763107 RepID=A0A7G8BKG9_9BACT|nr:UbiA family prenyltransferase [Alloacidobacterium dinghuense]QNI33039.1 UbiA family prenyltransferase [Alloacidobacterium dinghuense]